MHGEYIEVPLRRGEVALIDRDDAVLILPHKWWCKRGYAVCCCQGKTIYMHRLLIDVPVGMEPDHINRNRLDNRRANLRLATRAQNVVNTRLLRSNNTSGFRGVFWDKSKCLWVAQTKRDGHTWTIGRFRTAEEAAGARDEAVREMHPQFACLNFGGEGA